MLSLGEQGGFNHSSMSLPSTSKGGEDKPEAEMYKGG